MSGNLDEVYERLRRTGPEFDGWLSNHGPMAADALLRIGSGIDVHAWVDEYSVRLEESPTPRWPIEPDGWREVLGDPSRLGDWLAFFDRSLSEEPWTDVLSTWWPRLLPGAVASATHGLIRTGHAVRALREEDTGPRRDELAQALGYWAARWLPVPGAGRPRGSLTVTAALDHVPVLDGSGGVRTRLHELGRRSDWASAVAAAPAMATEDVPAAIDDLVDAAVRGYGRWATGNPVMLVHAATAPRAASLALPSLPTHLWTGTYEAAWVTSAAIAAVYRPAQDLATPAGGRTPGELIDAVDASGDEHAIKFAEVAAEAHKRGVDTAIAAGLRAVELIG